VLVVVLENPDRFAIRLTEQISSIDLFAVTAIPMHRGRGRFQFSEFGFKRLQIRPIRNTLRSPEGKRQTDLRYTDGCRRYSERGARRLSQRPDKPRKSLLL
jgi:hypothetical protein